MVLLIIGQMDVAADGEKIPSPDETQIIPNTINGFRVNTLVGDDPQSSLLRVEIIRLTIQVNPTRKVLHCSPLLPTALSTKDMLDIHAMLVLSAWRQTLHYYRKNDAFV